MAVNKITVNAYDVPKKVKKSDVATAAVQFNTNTIESYSNKYIGTSKSARRKLIKKIASGVASVVYTVYFLFEKGLEDDAHISYSLSEGDNVIIESDQTYSTTSDFSTDIEYINTQIQTVFK